MTQNTRAATVCPLWWDSFLSSDNCIWRLPKVVKVRGGPCCWLNVKKFIDTYARAGMQTHIKYRGTTGAEVFFCLFPDCCFHSCFQTCSFNTSLKDYLSGCCFTCRLLSLHLVFLLLLPAAVLSFVTRQPWIRNTDYMLVINETMQNISYTMWDSSALCFFFYTPQRRVQSTKGCLGGVASNCVCSPKAVQYNV